MASPQAEAARLEQEAIAALALPLVAQAWDVLEPGWQSPGVLEAFREAIESIVSEYGQAAAGAAVEFFRDLRSQFVRGRFPVRPVLPAPESFIDAAVVEAVAARAVAESDSLAAKVEQLVLNEGRKQLLSAVAQDEQARGWARIPNPGACSFCLMLATRGAVYRTRAGAGAASNRRFTGAGSFKVHDNCRCGIEPFWGGSYEPTAQVREAQALWAEATKGRKGHDARVAFRQAVEGREVTGAPGKSSRSKATGKSYAEPQGRTPESQRAQLRVLEAMPPAKTPEAAEWRRRRIAEIRKFLGE